MNLREWERLMREGKERNNVIILKFQKCQKPRTINSRLL